MNIIFLKLLVNVIQFTAFLPLKFLCYRNYCVIQGVKIIKSNLAGSKFLFKVQES